MKPTYSLQFFSKRLALQTKLKENFLKSDRKIVIWLCKAQSDRNLKSSWRYNKEDNYEGFIPRLLICKRDEFFFGNI